MCFLLGGPLKWDGCTDLTSSEFRVIELKTKRSLKYFCVSCQEGLRLIPVLQKRIGTLEQRLVNLEKVMHAGFEELKSISKQTVPAPDRSDVVSPGDEMMREVVDRQRRMNNIMIFNLSLKPDESDASLVSSVMSEVLGHQVAVSGACRVGKPNRNGHKPVRVTLSSGVDVGSALKNRGKFATAKQIYVEADLTPVQMERLQGVRNELNRRRADGEEGLVIRWQSGVPSIVQKTKN